VSFPSRLITEGSNLVDLKRPASRSPATALPAREAITNAAAANARSPAVESLAAAIIAR
jgi:hypothetical protein